MLHSLTQIIIKHKLKFIIALIILITTGFLIQLYLFYNADLEENAIYTNFIQWSEYCDGKVYTAQEKADFCQSCFNKSGKCEWPLDMNFTISSVDKIISSGAEIHCYLTIDNISLYKEKGSYFGITSKELFTWELLDATQPHEVEFCCESQAENIFSLLGLKTNSPQICTKKSVGSRC
jgi:hypothetical protein